MKRYWLLVILLISFFFRFYRLSEFFYWSWDEEVLAMWVERVVVRQQPTLVGLTASLDLTTLPYFDYFAALVYFVSRMNPLGGAVVGSGLGVLTTYLVYVVGRTIWEERVGLLASFFYASSFLVSLFDRRFWPFTPFPLLFTLFVYLLWLFLKQKQTKTLTILLIVIALSLGTEPGGLVLLVVAVLVLLLFKVRIWQRKYLSSFFIFLLVFLPIAIFDLRHDFINSKRFLAVFSRINHDGQFSYAGSIYQQLFLLPDVFSRILYLPLSDFIERQFCYCYLFDRTIMTAVIFLLAIVILTLFVIRSGYYPGDKILLISLVIFMVGQIVYTIVLKGNFFQHYLTIILPVFALVLARASIYFNSKFVYAFLIIFFLVNVNTLLFSKTRYGYNKKVELIKWARTATDQTNIGLYILGDFWLHGGGWRYLFKTAGFEVKKSYLDLLLSFMYAEPPAYEYPATVMLIAQQKLASSCPVVSKRDLESFSGYIVNNEGGDFLSLCAD